VGTRDDLGTVTHRGGAGAPHWQSSTTVRIGMVRKVREFMECAAASRGGG
jgi:hypothetical protein